MSDGHVIKLRLSLMGRPVRNYTFDKSVISVGRDPGADVYVDNPGVSRDHFRLERSENGEYQVVDLGSANGTFVNDQMVNAALVHNNDVVRFGKYTLWVGYEMDRRSGQRGDGHGGLSDPESPSHTVVLSRAEIGNILEKEKRQEVKIISMAMSESDAPPVRKARAWRKWAGLAAAVVFGTTLGAVAVWLLLKR